MTTSAFEGFVADPAGSAISGTIIVLTRVPTGTQTDASGKFLLNKLRPIGPYALQMRFVGYTTQTQAGLYPNLGKVARQTFRLVAAATALGEVTVVGNQSDPFSADKNGQAFYLGREAIQSVPTLNRSLGNLTP
ncbi:hypothetical protein CDA63_16155 [Hymenobacter amundsenii]|uniref:TonB-dependent receptor n=1 Tax=Hymenobacter amundsenii TaxID=2006685 RepID=A0A246FHN9_9BACT|nr:carboxypeptidase-like regulatory domain-containing protein [Hymenobacter amundsenii]OWP62034.1 hypothetical protein CDA63_16155 [Hymenobacter amundsenii]